MKDSQRNFPRRQNSLQSDRDLSIYTLFLLSPGHQVLREAFFEGEEIRPLRKTPRKKKFQEAMCNSKTRLKARGHLKSLIERALSEVSFAGRQSVLKKQTKKTKGKFMPFVTTYHPGAKNLKQILMQNWSLIQNQPPLKTIYRTPPITMSYKKEKSLKDTLVREKLWRPTYRYLKIT